MSKQIPELSRGLIEMLDEHIPHLCPSPMMADRDIWIYAGKRQLVDDLKAKLTTADKKEEAKYVQFP